jgi:hypothetical protein
MAHAHPPRLRKIPAPVVLTCLLFVLVAVAPADSRTGAGRTLLLVFAGLCLALAWTALLTLSRRLGRFGASG